MKSTTDFAAVAPAIMHEIASAVASKFPVTLSPYAVEVQPPTSQEEYERNSSCWKEVFRILYSQRDKRNSVAQIFFYHQLPDRPAPNSAYSRQEQFWLRHPWLAGALRVAVQQKTVPGEIVEIEARDANLLFAEPEELESKSLVSFCLTKEEAERIHQPGLMGGWIMLPIQHPRKLYVPAGAIRKVALA